MIKISITGGTPLEALASLTALGMRCMENSEVSAAAGRILEAEERKEKAEAVDSRTEAAPTRQAVEPISDSPKEAFFEDGGSVSAPASDDKRPAAPTVEQARAEGIAAARKYGKEAVTAVLRKFGAAGISTVAEADRAAFLAELKGLGEGNA